MKEIFRYLHLIGNAVAEDGDFSGERFVDVNVFGQVDDHVEFLVARHRQRLALAGRQFSRCPEVRQKRPASYRIRSSQSYRCLTVLAATILCQLTNSADRS